MILLGTKTKARLYIIEGNTVTEFRDISNEKRIIFKKYKDIEEFILYGDLPETEPLTITEANEIIENVSKEIGVTPPLIPLNKEINYLPNI